MLLTVLISGCHNTLAIISKEGIFKLDAFLLNNIVLLYEKITIDLDTSLGLINTVHNNLPVAATYLLSIEFSYINFVMIDHIICILRISKE